MRKVLDANGGWHPINSIMPALPDPADPRGVTKQFHGRYRGAHNTGVPDRSALKTPRFGGIFNTPNQTYEDEHFVGYVEVRATGITFNRCYFEGRGDITVIRALMPATFVDCDMNAGNYVASTTVVTGSVHCIRCHIWGGGQDIAGFDDDGQYDDCYLHGNVPHYGTHSDSAQTLGGNNLAVRRSKLLAYNPITNSPVNFNSVLALGSTLEPVTNLEVLDNYIDGGGFAINGVVAAGFLANALVRGNRWGRHALYGPVIPDWHDLNPIYGTFDRATNVYDDNGVSV